MVGRAGGIGPRGYTGGFAGQAGDFCRELALQRCTSAVERPAHELPCQLAVAQLIDGDLGQHTPHPGVGCGVAGGLAFFLLYLVLNTLSALPPVDVRGHRFA